MRFRFFSDRRRPMVSHPLGEFLLGLLAVVRRNFDHDAIFRLVKNRFLAVKPVYGG